MGRIFLIAVGLIVYGSLYPWAFHARELPASPVWMLFHSWPASLDRFALRDAAVNLLIYLPVGTFGSLTFARAAGNVLSVASTLLFALALSGSIEMLQLFDDARVCSCFDLLCNVSGAAVGILVAQIHGRSVVRMVAPAVTAVFRPRGALFLMLCWLGYQTFPMIPHLSTWAVAAKLRLLWSSASFSAVPAIGAVVDWLVAARLLETILGPHKTRAALAVVSLLLPARLLISGRSFTWPELVGAACAWTIWSCWLCQFQRRTILLAWLMAAVLLLRGLAPFHFSRSPAPFSWTPFAASFGYDHGAAFLVFLDKSFLYGSAVWMFCEAGYSALRSVLGLALLLALIEAAQVYLPGRTAEITDPIFVLILAGVLRLLEAGHKPAATASGTVGTVNPH